MMRLRVGAMVLGGLVALGGTAMAQEEGGESKLSTSRKSELDRMKSRLELSDAQYEKVVKIFEKADAELKDLLTANQKETYNERYNRQRGGGGFGGFGGRGGGMGGMMRGMQERMTESLTSELGLSEEQQGKLKKIMDANMEKVEKVMAEARETGDWSKMREIGTTMRDEGMKQIKEILTDEQKAKFDELAQNMGGMMGGRGGFGRRGGDRGERGRRGSSVEWRLRNILRDLNLSEDEKLILEPTIKAVLEAQDAARKAIDEARRALRESSTNTTDEASLKAAMGKVREAETSGEKNVEAKRVDLRELVTFAQEAVLVGHGVLK